MANPRILAALGCFVFSGCYFSGDLPDEATCFDARYTGANCDRLIETTCPDPRYAGDNCDELANLTWIQSAANQLYFMKAEVTVDQFRACVDEGSCSTALFSSTASDPTCNYGNNQRGQHPMNCVDWNAAAEFCSWLKARLPSNAEMLSEATNNSSRTFPWGDSPSPDCHHVAYGCGLQSTAPVCSKPKGNSVSGLCDLNGNVAEWTQMDECNNAMSFGFYPSFGGSWADDIAMYFGGVHGCTEPGVKSPRKGFRCIRDAAP